MRLESVLFNRTRQRAKKQRQEPHNFYAQLVTEEARQRLDLVQHTFQRGLVLGATHLATTTPLAPKNKVASWVYSDTTPNHLPAPAFVCDDEALPVRAESFDLVAHLLRLHQANQVPQVLKNIHAALRPDGMLLACLFAPDSLLELKHCLLQAEEEITGGAAQRFIPLADVRTLGNLLQAAGFALPVADLTSIKIHYKSFAALLRDLRAAGETQSFSTPPPFLRRAVLQRTETLYNERFATDDGKLIATFNFAWLIGWKPHPTQPQPLKPGSAKHSFAQAVQRAQKL